MVHVSRATRSRGAYAALGIAAVAIAGALILGLWPPAGGIADRQEFERQEQKAWTGEKGCAGLQQAKRPLTKSQEVKAADCAASAERYREAKQSAWQAIRTAQAAENTATWTRRQAAIGAVNVAILFLALVASGVAAYWAFRAVRAANETLEHERQAVVDNRATERHRERAYAFIGFAEKMVGPFGHRLIINVRNYGKTPAFLKRIAGFYFATRPADGTSGTFMRQSYDVDFVFGADQLETLTPAPFDVPRQLAYVGLEITYEDIFGCSHYSRSLCRIDERPLLGGEFLHPYWNDWS